MSERKRTHEVRLLVVVIVDLGDPYLHERLAQRRQPGSIGEVVAHEVIDTLETVAFIDAVVASCL